jgi:hypothetical protein
VNDTNRPAKSKSASSKSYEGFTDEERASDNANLDDGAVWPVAYALTELSAADEARIGELVKEAVS